MTTPAPKKTAAAKKVATKKPAPPIDAPEVLAEVVETQAEALADKIPEAKETIAVTDTNGVRHVIPVEKNAKESRFTKLLRKLFG